MKNNYRIIGKSVPKKDADMLLRGKGVYAGDLCPADALVVKILRSPHPHALVAAIDTAVAKKVPGVVDVYTWEDVPQNRFTIAGQTYPEPSPYDRLILDRRLRFVGDAVAIVAAENEKAADKALKLIKVTYEVLEPVLDFRTALDNPVLVHPEEDWLANQPVGADNQRNLCARDQEGRGDVDAVMADCPIVLDRVYHTKACNQAMMETFRTWATTDRYGRLHVVSSTQIVFHARRILSNALGIPKSKIRVEKPRIGGGFGAKQSAVCEVYPAFVAWKTGRPAQIVYTRQEAQIAGSPRHEMEVHVKLGANTDGTIRALDVYTLSNTGAYGEHGPTTVGLTGHKPIPLYTGSLEAWRFGYDVVYTNTQASGAYRGYGATQGTFAMESAVNELAETLGMDPVAIREKNMVREGMVMSAYYDETANSCTLDKCLRRCGEMFDWQNKYPVRDMGNGKVRASGVAMTMQGSAIPFVDVGSATVKLNEDEGSYTLLIGAADMGTGCDTVLSQMVAESMGCEMENVSVFGADTDASPYDSGSYASSTTYLTGQAVVEACTKLKEQICAQAAAMLSCDVAGLSFEPAGVRRADGTLLPLRDIAVAAQCGSYTALQATATRSTPVAPPPFMVSMVEIELDKETGVVEVLDTCAVADCGTPINENLARIQAEGGLVQGIGMALFENVTRDSRGRILEDSFMQYKIPSRLDTGKLRVEFEPSFEPTGPFGAKSIGEVVINTPAPAIAHAVYRATGRWHRELPITPEKIIME